MDHIDAVLDLVGRNLSCKACTLKDSLCHLDRYLVSTPSIALASSYFHTSRLCKAYKILAFVDPDMYPSYKQYTMTALFYHCKSLADKLYKLT